MEVDMGKIIFNIVIPAHKYMHDIQIHMIWFRIQIRSEYNIYEIYM